MPAIKTKLNARSQDFLANAEKMQSLIDDLQDKMQVIAQGKDASMVSTPPSTSRSATTLPSVISNFTTSVMQGMPRRVATPGPTPC